MKTVMLPQLLDGTVPRGVTEQLAAAAGDRHLTFDFSRVEFAYPLGILTFGREIRRAVELRRQQRQMTMVAGDDRSKPVHSFLSHVGFFDFIGLPYAKPIGAARGNDRYVPIRRFTRAEVGAFPGADSKRMRESIAAQSEGLAAVIAGGGPDAPAYWPVAYSIREVIRNVFEHSRADECFVTAQKWATGAVEMAVLDEGVGIRASLAEAVDCDSDAAALAMAVKAGVSRTARAPRAHNAHENSGFGLYVLSELGRCFGRFTLSSGSACMTSGTEGAAFPDSAAMSGTAVGLKLTNLPHSFSGTLDDIVMEGEKDAAENGRIRTASRASRSQQLS